MVQHALSALQDVDGTILHIGAGECSELSVYLATRAERIVLVEPVPELVYRLRQRTKQEDRVTIIEAAVTDKNGKTILHHFNVSDLATLHPPEEPPLRWPGLCKVSQYNVKTVGLSGLLEKIDMQQGKVNWLVIECPGEEETVLHELGKNYAHSFFQYISLHTSSMTPRIDTAWPRLRKVLYEVGYCLEDIFGQSDDRVYHASIATNSLKSSQLEKQLKEAMAERHKLTNQLAEERGEARIMKEKLDRFAKQVDEEKSTSLKHVEKIQELLSLQGSLRQENRQLKAENEEIEHRQVLLEEELCKADVQLELIKELFLSKEDAEQLENKVKDA